MTIEQWGAIGEIVGALAVVASLVYLAVQIRQNTRQLAHNMKATELAAFERNVEAGNRIREMLIVNQDVLDLYTHGIKNYRRLEPAEKIRFGMVLSNLFSAFQGAYIRQLTYANDPNNFAGGQRMLDRLIRLRGVKDWLQENEPDWRPEFAALVAERIAAGTGADAD
jgi:hypothetical protein